MATPDPRQNVADQAHRAAHPGSADRAPSPSSEATVGGWVASLLQLADTFYPTGSYAHSFGLEALVQDGDVRDLATLRTFLLEEVLPALARTDLSVTLAVWAEFEAGGAPDEGDRAAPHWPRIGELCHLGHSQRGAREPRDASAAIGRQRADLAARLRGGGLAAAFANQARAEGWPQPTCVVAAIEARACGAPVEAALAAQIYSTASALIAAAVKLLRLGQNAAQTLLTEAVLSAPRLIEIARATPPDLRGSFNPWWDIAAARHETADFRLFIS